MSQTAKIAEVLFENALDTYQEQTQMMDLVEVFKPSSGDMQNAGNVVWRPVEQHAPILPGWDLTGQEQDIIEEAYPAYLGTPANDFVRQRADDLRTTSFWEKRGRASGKQQATELNRALAEHVAKTGSIYYEYAGTSGFDFVAQAQAIMNERQCRSTSADMRNFVLNDRSNLKYAGELAARQTLQGQPAETWKTGQIGGNIAEFDIFTGSYLPTLAGGANPGSATVAAYDFVPEGGSVNAVTNVVTNVDYREAVITVVAGAGYAVGDKVSISNGGAVIESIGVSDKSLTGQPMTFAVVAINGNNLTIWPKPIAWDSRPAAQGGNGTITATQAASANVNTSITNGATVDRLNLVNHKANIFWAKDSVEITGGDIPAELMAQYDGMKVVSSQMKSGQTMYMVYDGDIATMNFRFRVFTWYGLTNANPSANGFGAVI